jgi:hypothetical protein
MAHRALERSDDFADLAVLAYDAPIRSNITVLALANW